MGDNHPQTAPGRLCDEKRTTPPASPTSFSVSAQSSLSLFPAPFFEPPRLPFHPFSGDCAPFSEPIWHRPLKWEFRAPIAEGDGSVVTGVGMRGAICTTSHLHLCLLPFFQAEIHYLPPASFHPFDAPACAVSFLWVPPPPLFFLHPPGLTNSPIRCHAGSSGSTLLETGHDTPIAPPPHLPNHTHEFKKPSHESVHACKRKCMEIQ